MTGSAKCNKIKKYYPELRNIIDLYAQGIIDLTFSTCVRVALIILFVQWSGCDNYYVVGNVLSAIFLIPCPLPYLYYVHILRWTLDLSCGPFKENCFSVTQPSWTSFASFCGGHAHHLFSQLMTQRYIRCYSYMLVIMLYCTLCVLWILYFPVIRYISLISTYCFVCLNVCCQAHFVCKLTYIVIFDLVRHRYLNTRMLVQGPNIQKLVEISMSMFDSHVLH